MGLRHDDIVGDGPNAMDLSRQCKVAELLRRVTDEQHTFTSLQIGRTTIDRLDTADNFPDNDWLGGRNGQFGQTTRMKKGTNQVQRVVVAKHLLR